MHCFAAETNKSVTFFQLLLRLISQQWYSFGWVAYETIDRADVKTASGFTTTKQGGSKENDERRAAPSTA